MSNDAKMEWINSHKNIVSKIFFSFHCGYGSLSEALVYVFGGKQTYFNILILTEVVVQNFCFLGQSQG